jgi:hypothetical protein
VEECWCVVFVCRGVLWDPYFGYHLASGGGSDFQKAICACGVEDWKPLVQFVEFGMGAGTFPVAAVCDRATTAFMPSCSPFGIYCACARRNYAGVTILVVAGSGYWWKTERLDMAAR